MSFLKNKWFLLLLNIILSFVLFLVFAPQYRFIHFINSSFYVTGVYLLLFIFLFITNGRFFDGLVFGVRRFRRSKSKSEPKDFLNESRAKRLPSEMINQSFYFFILFQGSAMLVMQIILLTIYYMR